MTDLQSINTLHRVEVLCLDLDGRVWRGTHDSARQQAGFGAGALPGTPNQHASLAGFFLDNELVC